MHTMKKYLFKTIGLALGLSLVIGVSQVALATSYSCTASGGAQFPMQEENSNLLSDALAFSYTTTYCQATVSNLTSSSSGSVTITIIQYCRDNSSKSIEIVCSYQRVN